MSIVLVPVYNILIEGWGLLLGNEWRILVVYDIMRCEEALYVPPSGGFLVVVVCVVELCVFWSLCTLYHSEEGEWCHYTLCTCNAACTQSLQ